ncbi:AAA family ATPase [Tumebacillus algifaecis]|uniref:AAA family ATPase n=1 Tax=Tumebacillus algifaecis TaxID=1214604 RepID=A0A223CZJ9_9BACL|nr:MoxR family ATPase [Tumebacillus algifaecis]ASS74778.1 AAA family ATPase [Tumebacillus algifaecis]
MTKKSTEVAQKIRAEVGKVIVGQEETLDLLLVGLFSGGHMLLEDVPGVGKTVLAKALAASIGSKFTRIQCTPDLLPSDVVGTTVFNQKSGEFEFREGPLFSQLVLADEINRAIPRTQSALLEAMAEGQITSDGVSRRLDRPFFVIATQNPIESHGTFPLPEAQLDRFLMRISLGYPTHEEERTIFRLSRQEASRTAMEAVVTPEDVIEVQDEVRLVHMNQEVEDYLIQLIRKTRNWEGVALGVSPRGLIALGAAAQALAVIRGRDYVLPDDIKYLAPKVLAHRLVLDSSMRMKQKTAHDVLEEILNDASVPVEDDAAQAAAR